MPAFWNLQPGPPELTSPGLSDHQLVEKAIGMAYVEIAKIREKGLTFRDGAYRLDDGWLLLTPSGNGPLLVTVVYDLLRGRSRREVWRIPEGVKPESVLAHRTEFGKPKLLGSFLEELEKFKDEYAKE